MLQDTAAPFAALRQPDLLILINGLGRQPWADGLSLKYDGSSA
jgi:hypothetical protein